MKQENILILVVAIIITLAVGGGVYWWQHSVLEDVKNELGQQINDLKNQLLQIEEERTGLEQQVDHLKDQLVQIEEARIVLQGQIGELTKEPERYVRIVSPNGGENLCMGKDFNIQWEHKGLVSVRILSYLPGEGTGYIGTLPADLNEMGEKGKGIYSWKIGSMFYGGELEEGTTYKIILEDASTPNSSIKDESDNIFSILTCEG